MSTLLYVYNAFQRTRQCELLDGAEPVLGGDPRGDGGVPQRHRASAGMHATGFPDLILPTFIDLNSFHLATVATEAP